MAYAMKVFEPTAQNSTTSIESDSYYARSKSIFSKTTGRAFEILKEGSASIATRMLSLFQRTLIMMSAAGSDTNIVAGVFRRLNKQVLNAAEYLSKASGCFNKMKNVSQAFVDWIDALQVAADVHYFCTGKFKEDSSLRFCARASAFISNVGSTLLWLEELSFIHLSRAASAIGNMRVFGFVPALINAIPIVRNMATLKTIASSIGELRVFSLINKLSLDFIARRTLTLAYIFFAADSIEKLNHACDPIDKAQASLDLSHYVSELVLDAMITVGIGNVVALGIVGAVCIGTALISIGHRAYYNK